MIDFSQALELYKTAPLTSLLALAHAARVAAKGDDKIVTWQIDRNINITNVCSSGCRFCHFHCLLHQTEQSYITSMEQYRQKIDELFALGGNQILLQGGMHPRLGLEFYEQLFRELKDAYPTLKLHALGPPEIFFIAKKAGLSVDQTLDRLIAAGLDSLPGAGAEILDNDWRRRNSPGKCSADEWIATMEVAHQMGLTTSATMMYGFDDTPELRIAHLFKLRDLQQKTGGFSAFIPWPYQGVDATSDSDDYLRIIAISRLVLSNFQNIQASWLTVGTDIAQLALHGGANDLGSIMIEENVVQSAGVSRRLDAQGMQHTIRRAGFTPALRDQAYNLL